MTLKLTMLQFSILATVICISSIGYGADPWSKGDAPQDQQKSKGAPQAKAKPNPPVTSSTTSVLLKRVFYNKTEFPQWTTYNVPNTRTKDTYIGIASEPPQASTEYLALFVAGQQGLGDIIGDSGYPNGVTGQGDAYKDGCDGSVKSCTRSINPYGLFGRVRATQKMPDASTFYAVVFDAQFNMGLSNKIATAQAFNAWLKSKAIASNLKGIYLAGASRGGCLVLRLTDWFRAHPDYAHVPVITQTMDGVCDHKHGELGNEKVEVDNPLTTSEMFGWRLDMPSLFNSYPHRSRLALFSVVGGAKVSSVASYRGFANVSSDIDYGWYRQEWVAQTHTTIGRGYSLAHYTDAVNHFKNRFDYLVTNYLLSAQGTSTGNTAGCMPGTENIGCEGSSFQIGNFGFGYTCAETGGNCVFGICMGGPSCFGAYCPGMSNDTNFVTNEVIYFEAFDMRIEAEAITLGDNHNGGVLGGADLDGQDAWKSATRASNAKNAAASYGEPYATAAFNAFTLAYDSAMAASNSFSDAWANLVLIIVEFEENAARKEWCDAQPGYICFSIGFNWSQTFYPRVDNVRDATIATNNQALDAERHALLAEDIVACAELGPWKTWSTVSGECVSRYAPAATVGPQGHGPPGQHPPVAW
jgi:hypothetical protein